MRTALSSVLVACASAAALHAQYAEPSAVVLFDKSIGVASNLFGWATVGLGDVNGDGVLDLAVSAPFATVSGHSSAGRVYALSGADGSTLWSHGESRTSAILGYSLETMDWNADGVLDVVTGAPFATTGRTWVFSGVDGATLAELVGEATNSGFGAAVATGGDVDGDGTPDLLVAAPFRDTLNGVESGRLYAYARGSLTPFTTVDGPYPSAQYGVGLAYVGDTDADGRDELVAGYRDAASFFDGFAEAREWNGSALASRYTVGGVGMAWDLMGDRIDGGGDANGDGAPDFLVGDLFHSEVELFSGTDGAPLGALDTGGESGDLGSAHFIPDVDHDGRADVVAGAWQSDAGAGDSGRVYVCSGASGALLKTITPTTANLNLGIDARGFGDVDGDGRDDLLIGAYGDGFGGSLPGRALVFSGHVPAPLNVVGPAALPGDPALTDAGGDPATGPLTGSALEPFDLALDCSGASAPGPFAIQVRSVKLAAPVATSFGSRWIGGAVLFLSTGVHAQDVVHATPGGVILPNTAALIGLGYGAQGLCGGRLSNGLGQTIGG